MLESKIIIDTIGYWWLPEKPEQKLYGKLEISKTNIELETLGLLSDLPFERDKKRVVGRGYNEPEYTRVFGHTLNGYAVIFKNHYGRTQKWSYGLESGIEKFSQALIGEENFSETEEICFESIKIKLSRLADFVGKSNISSRVIYDDDKIKTTEFKIEHDYILDSVVTAEYTIKFETSYKGNLIKTEAEKKYPSMEEFHSISFEKTDGSLIKLDDVRKIQDRIRAFLAFALRDSIYLVNSIGYNSNSTYNKLTNPSKNLKTTFYYPDRFYEEGKSKLYNFLFRYDDIKENFGKYLTNWFYGYDKNKVLYDNFFGQIYNKNQYLESNFLASITSLESYHKNNFDPKKWIVDKKGEKKKVKKNLKDKIDEILTFAPQFLTEKIIGQNVEDIKKIRDEIAHEGIQDPEKTIDKIINQDLIWKLKRMNEVCLMRIIGFTGEQIQTFISRYY